MKVTTFYKNDKGEYRWRTRASNGHIVESASEGFSGKRVALANFFDNHPTLDRNTVQTQFDGSISVIWPD